MKFAIVISTYYRKDHSTLQLLVAALKSILKQTYKEYKIYLIGDNYTNTQQFEDICNQFPQKDKLYCNNLSFAKERDVYTLREALWCYGGVNAVNFGINRAIEDGFDYICHIDHDDLWEEAHLETLKQGIEATGASWLSTRSNHLNYKVLPVINSKDLYTNYIPQSGDINHSSVCMNFKHIPIRYLDYFEEYKKIGPPADEYMWQRAYKYGLKNNLKFVVINKLTCFHLQEGFIKH